MNPQVRNILAVIAGIIIGIVVNMGISTVGFLLVDFPADMNREDPVAMAAFIEQLPATSPLWLGALAAHIFGTVIGALVTSRIAVQNHVRLAIGVGVFFLIGGIINKLSIPHPLFIAILDLILYIPAAWFGWKLAGSPSAMPGKEA